MDVKISVIVPVYNVERYLCRCVDSILAQSFTDFELLLVDDGSRDKSGSICDEYAKKDFRVKVFHQENGGVSSARNKGLHYAKGEYITFIDSDDYIEGSFFNDISKCTTDILIMQCKHFGSNKKKHFSEIVPECIISTPKEINSFLSKYMQCQIIRTPWGKFFKRDVLQNIQFNYGQNIGEDTVFVLEALQQSKSITVSSNSFYMYLESETPDQEKYKLKVEHAVLFLSNIYQEYLKLGIVNHNFEKAMFWYFKSLCDDNLNSNLDSWYKNRWVKQIWKRIKKDYTWRFRLKYQILSHKLFFIIYTSIIDK